MDDRTLQAIIRLRDEISRPLRTVRGNLEQLGRNVDESNRRLGNLSTGMKTVGKGAVVAGGAIVASLGSAFIYSTKKAIEFESAFAGVKKTLNTDGMSAGEIKTALDGISTGLMNMSNHMPQSAAELAAIAETGGQLGIAKENILSFTETMAMLGDTTNLTSDEVATSFAQIANVTRMPQTKFDELGSTIVALGNDGASTEADIVGLMNRIAAGGKQVEMSVPQIASWSSAMASLGITAEAGGTSFNKTLGMMQIAVETNSSKLGKFAKVAGMSASEFKKAFKDDASGALFEFTKGLGNTERNGKSTIAVLEDLGINSSEQIQMLSKLAGGTQTVADSLATGSKAWKENNALQNEAKQRYGTTESALKMMRNQIDNASITIGNAFLPVLRDAAEWVGKIAEKFSNLDPNTKKLITTIALLTFGIGTLLLVGGGLLIFASNVMGAFAAIGGAGLLTGIGASVVNFGKAIMFTFKFLGTVFVEFGSMAMGALRFLGSGLLRFGSFAMSAFRFLGSAIVQWGQFVGAIFRFIGSSILKLGGYFLRFGGMALNAIRTVAMFLMANPIAIGIMLVIGVVVLLYNAWKHNWGGIREKTAVVVGAVKGFIQGLISKFNTVKSTITTMAKTVLEKWQNIKNALKNPIKTSVTVTQNIVKNIKEKLFGGTNKGGKRSAYGTNRVVGNDVPYRLHDGERVLTMQQANAYDRLQKEINIKQNIVSIPLKDATQNIKQNLIPAKINSVDDLMQNIKQNLNIAKIPKVDNLTQSIKQKLSMVKIPKVADMQQNIKQNLIHAKFNPIKDMQQNIKQNIINAKKPNLQKISETITEKLSIVNKSTANKKGEPKAFGLNRVPYNGYQATLHEGERVLTKKEVNQSDNNKVGGNIVINMNGVTIREEADVKRVAKALVRELKMQQISFGGVY